jgi:two-component system, cell cycle sensor histidine kinase and response regulator CckA
MELTAPQRIIVVDDDDFVRETMETVLVRRGHAVRATASGVEALRWLEEDPCDLLILDCQMPEMDGPTLYREVIARWPSARVLFVSGSLAVGDDDPDVLGVPVLLKPFSLDALFKAVTQALVTA